jgi:hypothetical protein
LREVAVRMPCTTDIGGLRGERRRVDDDDVS